MATLILLNKPFHTLCQFSDEQGRSTLADYVRIPGVYPAGRLDYDSEGLVLLTDDGTLQHRIASPRQKMRKTYLVQVEGEITDEALQKLRQGLQLKDGLTRPADARRIAPPALWPRIPPVRERAEIPTSWLELTLTEGRNRQVRRMTAATGFPTLRLIRWCIGEWTLEGLTPGQYRKQTVHMPTTAARKRHAPSGQGPRKPPQRHHRKSQ
ncbi:pseudouridine synthase [Marinobacter sp.]|uniref:pseudouridine synthase n=1 Tax=Marinobacter sp. TaxID=50741 RepID=UPI0035644A30